MSGTVWSIGRKDARRCDVLLDGDTISAVQASLNYMDGKFYLIDNMSRNGSYLIRGGNKILLDKHTEVLPNDAIIFGASEFSFDELLRVSSQSEGHAVRVLTIKDGENKPAPPRAKPSPRKPSKPKLSSKQSPSQNTKKIRCMECMKPIPSNAICPSCGSRKHLKGV